MKTILIFSLVALGLAWASVVVLGMVSLVFSPTLAKGIYLSELALLVGGLIGWLKTKLD